MSLLVSDARTWGMTIAAAIFGAAIPLAYAPYEHASVAILSIAGFYIALQLSSSWCMAAWLGFVFGFSQFATGLNWIHVSIDTFGGLPLPASLLIMLLLCCYLALFPALVGWLWYRLCKHKPGWIGALVFPSLWLFSELLRATFFTGFPWLALGYSQTSSWLFAWAPVIGVQGIGWLVAFVGVSLGQISRPKRLWWIAPALVIVALLTYKAQELRFVDFTGNSAKVALVQGNVSQILKWAPEQQWPTMRHYEDMSRPYYGYDLIIWPEAAIPAIELAAQDYLQNIDKALSWQGSALITGIIDYQPDSRRYFNNLITLGRLKSVGNDASYHYGHSNRYSKHHLLPIGEFVPFQEWLRPIAPLFNLPMSSFSEGDYRQPNLEANGWLLTPALCYEILFSEQVRENTQDTTDFILTVSNDAWFGNSIGPHQHLEIARMRAKELGRPVLRGTNNGLTAVIDADGSLVAQIPQFEATVLTAEVNQYRGRTPFADHGHWPLLFWCLFTVAVSFLIRRRQRIVEED